MQVPNSVRGKIYSTEAIQFFPEHPFMKGHGIISPFCSDYTRIWTSGAAGGEHPLHSAPRSLYNKEHMTRRLNFLFAGAPGVKQG